MISTETTTRLEWRLRYRFLPTDTDTHLTEVLTSWEAVEVRHHQLVTAYEQIEVQVVEYEVATRVTVLGDLDRARNVRDTAETEAHGRRVATQGAVDSRRCVAPSGLTGAAACGRVIMPDPDGGYRHIGALAVALDRDHAPYPSYAERPGDL